MAWTTSTPAGGLTTRGPSDYWTYRSIKGRVEMRLTDVTFASGYVFHYFQMAVRLLTSGGITMGAGTLGKYWGVLPGFAFLGAVQPASALRIRVDSTYDSPSNASGQWLDFRSELRWDNSNIS